MRALTRTEAAARAALITSVGTRWELDLRPAGHAVTRTTTSFTCSGTGASTFIDAGFEVTSAELNGRPVEAVHGRIALTGLAERNIVEVTGTVAYRRDGQGLHRFTDPVDGRVYLHTKFQPFDAHHTFACFDQPDVKGPLTLTVTAPESWQVVANTQVTDQSVTGDGGIERRFATTAPLPPYLVAVVAGPYSSVRRTVDGLDVGLHTRPSLAAHLDVDELVELTHLGRRYYEGLFGIGYPFGDHYDIAFVPEYGFGAMEHPGCVTAHERFVFAGPPTAEQRRRRSEVLLHEMAHMWFGNLVTLRWWDDLWLNESFATLLAALAQSEATDTGAATWAVFAADAKVRAREADRLPTTHPVHGTVEDTDRVRSTFDAITYRKGAALLRQRLHETGRHDFFAGLSRFLREHAHGNASAGQLHRALGPVGGRDGESWAADWLGTTGAPEVHVARLDRESWSLTLVLPGSRSTPPIAVTVVPLLGPVASGGRGSGAGGSSATERVRTGPPARLLLAPGAPVVVPGGPEVVALVPNADDGHYATVVPDLATLAVLVARVGAIDDPVARAVVWATLWEAVIDGRLGIGGYVDAVVDHGGAETVPGVRQVLIERAVEGVWQFSRDTGPGSPRARLAAFARSGLDAGGPGGDRHRSAAETLAAVAVSPEERRALRVAGEAYADGDHRELRWLILAGRCRAGDADDRAVSALMGEDGSDVAHRGRLRARASMPTVAAKAEAWALATGTTRSLAERQAALEGWAAPGQDGLRRPYEAGFADDLVTIEQSAGSESALVVARTAFPRWPLDGDALVVGVQRLIRDGGVADPVRRALVEQVALLDRRRRARAAANAS